MLPPLSLFPCDGPHPLDGQVFEAIATRDIPLLQALFAAGARPNAVHPSQGHGAISEAVQQGDGQQNHRKQGGSQGNGEGNRELIQILIDQGADINAPGHRGETALMAAASRANLALVTLLLDQGAQVDAMSHDGDTALCLAAGATRWVPVDQSSTKAGEVEQPPGIIRATPAGREQLHPADEDQVIAVVEQLLEAGAQLNRSGCSATPLMEAARYGQLRLLALLLQRGAQPKLQAKDGQTALDIAKLYNQTRALTLLEARQFGDDQQQSKSEAVVA